MNTMGSRNEPNLDSINKEDFGNYGSSQNDLNFRDKISL